MKTVLISLFGAAAMLTAGVTSSSAGDRYAERPPVMVSPDLSAPWVLQLGRAPGIMRQNRQVVQQPRLRYAQPAQPDQVRTAAVQAPAKRMVMRPQINPIYLPQEVAYDGPQKPGTVVINTNERFLYLVQGDGKALRYGVGVGRDGFTWSGTERISHMSQWPDWHPPKEMIERQPYLPRFMAGGEGNPLGARALYLGNTVYRIHGTNQPSTIGHTVSSGCIRLTNQDIEDLYGRVNVGTRVVVLPGAPPPASASAQNSVTR